MKNPYMVGKSVYLRHPTREDAEGAWHEWISDEDTTKYLVDRYWPNSPEQQMAFFESLHTSRDRLVLSVVDRETDTHIGVCNLSLMNWAHKYCNMSLIMGAKEFRKGAHAFEACALLTKAAFVRLNMENVTAAYASGNELIDKVLKVLGYEPAGRYPGLYRIDGVPQDSVMVIMSRAAWLERNGYPKKA